MIQIDNPEENAVRHLNVAKLVRSFIPGFAGLAHVVATEQNFRIHLVAAVVAIAAGFYFHIAAWEWVSIILCIGIVFSAECINSSLERLADRVSVEKHPLVKHAKDCAAAAVLVLAMAAITVAAIIFLPKIWSMVHG